MSPLGVFAFFLYKTLAAALEGCEPFNVILPVACGSRGNERGKPFTRIPDHVIVLHTTERPCRSLFECCQTIDALRKYQIQKLGWLDIGYNFLIGNDGRVYVGRGWQTVGQFSLRYNERALAVAFVGDYFYQEPPGKALEVVKRFLACSVTKARLARNYTIHMHEDVECSRNPAPALRQKVATLFSYKGQVNDYVKC